MRDKTCYSIPALPFASVPRFFSCPWISFNSFTLKNGCYKTVQRLFLVSSGEPRWTPNHAFYRRNDAMSCFTEWYSHVCIFIKCENLTAILNERNKNCFASQSYDQNIMQMLHKENANFFTLCESVWKPRLCAKEEQRFEKFHALRQQVAERLRHL